MEVRVFLALAGLADVAQRNMQGAPEAFVIHQSRQRGMDQQSAEIFGIRK